MWINLLIWISIYIYSGFIRFGGATDPIPCEKYWFYFQGNCYKVGGKEITGRLNWEQARDKCKSEGAKLATIQNKELQEFLTTFLLMDAKFNLWIGLNDRANRSVYVWDDGSAFNFSDWQINEPLSPHEEWEQCVKMAFIFYFNRNGLPGQWNDLLCTNKLAYICQKTTGRKSSPDPRFCSGTQGGWKYENNCYHLVSEKKTWDDAEQHCQEKFNGHLITVLDFTVDVFIEYILSHMEVWIGIKLQDKSLQQWSSGWYVGYNDWNKDETEDFVPGTCALRSKNKWRKFPCSRNYSFICETSSVGPPVLKQPAKGSKCPDLPGNWRDLGGEYCYIFDLYNRMSFYKANFECVRRGGSLASIHSIEESIALSQFIKHTERDLHIGLLRHADAHLSAQDVFVWSDGSPMDYQGWYKDEPNSEGEKCGELWTTTTPMTWNDVDCGRESGYICSVKKVSPNITEVMECSCSDLSFEVVIGVSVCILLMVILIGCIIYCFSTGRLQRRRMSSGLNLPPPVPTSPRPRYITGKEEIEYYENMG